MSNYKENVDIDEYNELDKFGIDFPEPINNK